MFLKNWLDSKFSKPFYFNRIFLLILSLFVLAASFLVGLVLKVPDAFASAGAWITLAGLMLNIKHTLMFHLNLSLKQKYDRLGQAGCFGSSAELTDKQEAYVKNIMSDEKFGVTYMIAGTLIWAYGSFVIEALIAC